jgi:hypothetical protein
MQSTPQDFDYTRNSIDVLQRNTTVAPEAADPQRLFVIALVIVVSILVLGLADRMIVVIAVAGAARRNVKMGTARIGFVQALS